MADRKYSIGEIDMMRNLIRWSYPSGVAYYEAERAAEIENRLRTYMQNGTEPKELEKMYQERMAAEQQFAQMRAQRS